MLQELIPLSEKKAWEECLLGLPHSFGHTWDSNNAMHLSGNHPTFLYHGRFGDTRFVCPIAERSFKGYKDIFTPYGISGFTGNAPIEEFQANWHQFMKDQGYVCAYIAQNPFVPFGIAPTKTGDRPLRNLYALELEKGVSKLFEALSGGRKGQVKKYAHIQQDIISDKEQLMPFFLSNYHQFMAGKSASDVYDFSNSTLKSLIASPKTSLFGSKRGNRVTAVAMFGEGNIMIDYLFCITLPEGRDLTTALLWHAVNYYQGKEQKLLNLGGGITAGDKLEDYKRRFGGLTTGFGSIRVIYNEDIYFTLCKEAGIDSLNTDYFPAYWSNRDSSK
ncbi:hypothetical protein [Flavihumibacter fluvii]|uniref:hypothetical protein n=1 Tax=Flavihumibacter fluvii TaxID=2838157 RepID=UPI001BDF0FB7|nr:hypothetical protein [Flavihumibacter fluvii]ULQ52436.1 hypothetical protein KJS93_20320 [Flavihumibacter fluvii]